MKFGIIALLLAAVAVPSVLFATQEQNGTEARIAAYKHEDGRVEFAMQIKRGGEWQERILPNIRTLGQNARTGKWLVSSSVTVPDFIGVYGGNGWFDWTELGEGELHYGGYNPDPGGIYYTRIGLRASIATNEHGHLTAATFNIACTTELASIDQWRQGGPAFSAGFTFYNNDGRQWHPVRVDFSEPDPGSYVDPNLFTWEPETTPILLRGTKSNGDTEDWWVNTFDVRWLLHELREYDQLSIGIVGRRGYVSDRDRDGRTRYYGEPEIFLAVFDNFGAMFATPLQENIDRCGTYTWIDFPWLRE